MSEPLSSKPKLSEERIARLIEYHNSFNRAPGSITDDTVWALNELQDHRKSHFWQDMQDLRKRLSEANTEVQRLLAALEPLMANLERQLHVYKAGYETWDWYGELRNHLVDAHKALRGAADETEPRHTGIEFLQTWMRTNNPLLGGMTPLYMLQSGRGEKLARFIEQAYEANQPENGEVAR